MKKIILICTTFIMGVIIMLLLAGDRHPQLNQTTNAAPNNGGLSMGYAYSYALSQDKPMLVYFYTKWCASCKRFNSILKLLNSIYSNSYNIVMIDCDDKYNQSIISDYEIEYYPTLYIVDKHGAYKKYIDSEHYFNIERLKFELDEYLFTKSKS